MNALGDEGSGREHIYLKLARSKITTPSDQEPTCDIDKADSSELQRMKN
jgi:hypothetical protein